MHKGQDENFPALQVLAELKPTLEVSASYDPDPVKVIIIVEKLKETLPLNLNMQYDSNHSMYKNGAKAQSDSSTMSK